MQIGLWILLAVILYAYVGYPALIWCIGRLRRCHQTLPATPPTDLTACVIITAYNEERVIGEKLESILRQRYPRELTDIVVVDDGSSDTTGGVVSRYAQQRVRLLTLPRRGKAAALNHAMLDCTADVLVFSDADTLWLPDTLRHLLAPLGDPSVGGVAGHVGVTKHDKNGWGERAYRAYETFIRLAETRSGSCASADGGLFALRRDLAECIPAGVTDDFYLSTSAIAKGQSLVYSPRAVVLEKSIDQHSNQYERRVRITVRGMESLSCRRALMNPLRFGIFALVIISHKLLRRLVPALLLLLFPLNIALVGQGVIYQTLFATQALFYAAALFGLLDRRKRLPKACRIAAYIVIGSVGTLVGVVKFLSGVRYSHWAPQKHEQESTSSGGADG